tara:strand:+ start:3304 stop:3576 length:273 start_codon:yes stop_codon:yes gene_type:complete
MGRILAFLAALCMTVAPWALGMDRADIAMGILIAVPFWLMVFVRRSKREIAAELALLPSAAPMTDPVRIYREGPDGEIYHDTSKDSQEVT